MAAGSVKIMHGSKVDGHTDVLVISAFYYSGTKMDHVAAILGAEVRLECSSESARKALGPMAGDCEDDDTDLCLPYSSKENLAHLLTLLQSLGLPFGSEPAGWSPADVFAQLREEAMVHGKIKTVAWRGRGDPVCGEM